MPKKIQILDCTLRDGGYVNDWRFGIDCETFVLHKLSEAGIDIVETGYLSKKHSAESGRTIFTSLEAIEHIVNQCGLHHAACMINYGDFDIEQIPCYTGGAVDTLRVAFHLCDLEAALDYCERLIKKGYCTFVQPMATMDYSQQDLSYMLGRCNQIHPTAVYIVDSFGLMQQDDVCQLFQAYDSSLKEDIVIGFHSHNNLQLSFPNSQEIIRNSGKRSVIIDSSVYGMGRGAGNLCTELLTKYLNESFGTSYQLVPILEVIDKYLNAIFIKTPWGYSVPFYVAAVNHCHPNYATYLLNKQTLGVQQINITLSQIPEEKKHSFDKTLAENLYLQFQACSTDDSPTLQYLRKQLQGRTPLILAPGKTILTHKVELQQYIAQEHPFVISVNFLPANYEAHMLFLSNTKRFASIEAEGNIPVVATSNLPKIRNAHRADYTSLILPGYSEADNAGLMLLRLLQRTGIRHVAMAGFDGFAADVHENYCNDEFINSTVTEIFTERNQSVGEQLHLLMQNMQIDFITPTRYV